MSWFQLDPSSLANRAQGQAVPSLGLSLCRGIIGFTLVSIAGFLPWGVFGSWFHRRGGELGLYGACAVVFIGLSGPLMHRLILGRGSLRRFYQLFSLAFAAYSIAWIVGWMTLPGHRGSLVGLLAGTMVMGLMLTTAFEAQGQRLKVVAALFGLNALGYFVGGVFETALLDLPRLAFAGIVLARPGQVLLAKMQWGVCYGLGLGAGLGLAFHLCQTKARALLRHEQEAGGPR